MGSLFSINMDTLFKWSWRLFDDPNVLWVRVMKDLYGLDGCYISLIPSTVVKDPWNIVIRVLAQLMDRGDDI